MRTAVFSGCPRYVQSVFVVIILHREILDFNAPGFTGLIHSAFRPCPVESIQSSLMHVEEILNVPNIQVVNQGLESFWREG